MHDLRIMIYIFQMSGAIESASKLIVSLETNVLSVNQVKYIREASIDLTHLLLTYPCLASVKV